MQYIFYAKKYYKNIQYIIYNTSYTIQFISIIYNKKKSIPKWPKQITYFGNSENNISNCESCSRQPKFYISSGNNGMLVKLIMQQRWWWTCGRKEDETLNFSWTQWCKKSFVQNLPIKQHPIEASTLRVLPDIIQKALKPSSYPTTKISNHLENHFHLSNKQQQVNNNQYHLSNKKALFYHMQQYYQAMGEDPFLTLPLTFHVSTGTSDPEFEKFSNFYNELEGKYQEAQKPPFINSEKNIWIIKPGENSNRGYGIQVLREYEDIKKIVEAKSGEQRTYIIQKYIEKPLLINRRKFDIRVYGLITSINGTIKGYFYEEGYIRTSSKEFTLKNLANKTIHLTNDAIQQYNQDYGKYEPGNKLSFTDFKKYLDLNFPENNIDFYRDILSQIKKIVTDTIRAVHHVIDPNRRLHSFEIFGYDFMIDNEFRVFLIEANTNPCLEVSSVLLGRIIPSMVDSALRIAVDPLLPLVDLQTLGKRLPASDFLYENKFQLIFDEKIDGPLLSEYLSTRSPLIGEIEEEEESNGTDSGDEVKKQSILFLMNCFKLNL